MNLSKTRYCDYIYCPKHCWLNIYKPQECKSEPSAQQHAAEGHRVGDLAKGLFGDFCDVTEKNADGSLDIPAMIAKTQELIKKGAETICEAAFDFDGCYCAVDILHREKGGYAIYEVKSSTAEKADYIYDIAYQKYVLENCGIKITGTYLVNINNQYVRGTDIEIHKLFKINDYSGDIAEHSKYIRENCEQAKVILNSEDEPSIKLQNGCDDCDYWEYCSKDVPKPSVLDLGGRVNRWYSFNNGIITFQDVLKSDMKLSAKQKRQIEYALNDLGTYADKKEIEAFLNKLSYPLYFLDFETMAPAIPEYVGTRPYQAIPFQYSLHFTESEEGEIRHSEFLGEPETDPRRALAEQLCVDIPKDVCTLAYHSSVERGIIEKLAMQFPDLSEHLVNIAEHIQDLEEPFRKGYYYKREMGKRSSIKVVLPAICPNDPELDYHKLDGVHNGDEARSVYPEMKNMSPEERKRMRQNLLKYCWLDTYAMVKLWQELVRVSK